MKLTRRLTLFGGLAGLAGAFTIVFPVEQAEAHGGFTFPATRTYACYVDGIEGGDGGNLQPTNPACQDALEQGGNYAFYNWFGNLISDSGDQHREFVADGKLCGPTEDFDAFTMGRSDWPTTELQSGSTITVEHNAWAQHPGTWYTYITKEGWDPSQPLAWDDLELIDEVVDPPLREGGVEGPEYYWDVQLPERSGQHILYSVWERSDSPESFYNCSDVVFDGNGGGSDPGDPGDGDSGDGDPGDGDSGDGDSGDGGETDPPATESCEVDFAVSSEWSNGYTADVEVTNTGSSSINDWTLEWDFPGDASITNLWSADYEQSGSGVTVEGTDWTGTIGAGESVSFGFNADASGGAQEPDGFTLNGSSCS